MTTQEAIEALKKRSELIKGWNKEWNIENEFAEAIDTVLSLINTGNKNGLDDRLQEKIIEQPDSQENLSNKKDRLYTDKDMEAFAEYLIGRNTEWITELERNETANTLIELWEQQRKEATEL